jgi:alpha-tubulin suppressor-like RCC1 family protein
MWGQISNEKTHIIPTKVNKLNNKIIDCSIGKFSYSAIDCTGMIWFCGDNKYS